MIIRDILDTDQYPFVNLRIPSEESFHLNSFILKTKQDIYTKEKKNIFTIEDLGKKKVFSLEEDLDVFLKSKGIDNSDIPSFLPSMCYLDKKSETSEESINQGKYKSLIKLKRIRKKKEEKKVVKPCHKNLLKRVKSTKNFWNGCSFNFPLCFQLKTAEFKIKDFTKKHISLSDSIEQY